jgi:hypothetical protein
VFEDHRRLQLRGSCRHDPHRYRKDAIIISLLYPMCEVGEWRFDAIDVVDVTGGQSRKEEVPQMRL